MVVLALALLLGNFQCQASCAFAAYHDSSECPDHPSHQAPSLCSHELSLADTTPDVVSVETTTQLSHVIIEVHELSFGTGSVAIHGPAPPTLRI